MTGEGLFLWPVGVKYKGSFVEGNKHGKGTLVFKDGSTYSGDF